MTKQRESREEEALRSGAESRGDGAAEVAPADHAGSASDRDGAGSPPQGSGLESPGLGPQAPGLAPVPGPSAQGPDAVPGPPWITTAYHRAQIDGQWLLVVFAMLISCEVFTGWRGVAGASLTALATLVVYGVVGVGLRPVRKKEKRRKAKSGSGHHPSARRLASSFLGRDALTHVLAMGLLLGLAMPLLHHIEVNLTAGALLGGVMHLCGRSHRIRAHPVAIVLLLYFAGVDAGLEPDALRLPPSFQTLRHGLQPTQTILRPGRLVIGDATNAANPAETIDRPWMRSYEPLEPDAVHRPEPGRALIDGRYTLLSDRSSFIQRLSSGELVRIEELFLGATGDATGASSRFLVIVLGFYLMYRRQTKWTHACWALFAFLATLLLLPVPWSAIDGVSRAQSPGWTILTAPLATLGPAAAVTYVAYFVFATPMTFIVMILAPMTAPMSDRGRWLYYILIGAGGLAFMWLLEAPHACYAALLLAGLISRPLDGLHRSQFV